MFELIIDNSKIERVVRARETMFNTNSFLSIFENTRVLSDRNKRLIAGAVEVCSVCTDNNLKIALYKVCEATLSNPVVLCSFLDETCQDPAKYDVVDYITFLKSIRHPTTGCLYDAFLVDIKSSFHVIFIDPGNRIVLDTKLSAELFDWNNNNVEFDTDCFNLSHLLSLGEISCVILKPDFKISAQYLSSVLLGTNVFPECGRIDVTCTIVDFICCELLYSMESFLNKSYLESFFKFGNSSMYSTKSIALKSELLAQEPIEEVSKELVGADDADEKVFDLDIYLSGEIERLEKIEKDFDEEDEDEDEKLKDGLSEQFNEVLFDEPEFRFDDGVLDITVIDRPDDLVDLHLTSIDEEHEVAVAVEDDVVYEKEEEVERVERVEEEVERVEEEVERVEEEVDDQVVQEVDVKATIETSPSQYDVEIMTSEPNRELQVLEPSEFLKNNEYLLVKDNNVDFLKKFNDALEKRGDQKLDESSNCTCDVVDESDDYRFKQPDYRFNLVGELVRNVPDGFNQSVYSELLKLKIKSLPDDDEVLKDDSLANEPSESSEVSEAHEVIVDPTVEKLVTELPSLPTMAEFEREGFNKNDWIFSNISKHLTCLVCGDSNSCSDCRKKYNKDADLYSLLIIKLVLKTNKSLSKDTILELESLSNLLANPGSVQEMCKNRYRLRELGFKDFNDFKIDFISECIDTFIKTIDHANDFYFYYTTLVKLYEKRQEYLNETLVAFHVNIEKNEFLDAFHDKIYNLSMKSPRYFAYPEKLDICLYCVNCFVLISGQLEACGILENPWFDVKNFQKSSIKCHHCNFTFEFNRCYTENLIVNLCRTLDLPVYARDLSNSIITRFTKQYCSNAELGDISRSFNRLWIFLKHKLAVFRSGRLLKIQLVDRDDKYCIDSSLFDHESNFYSCFGSHQCYFFGKLNFNFEIFPPIECDLVYCSIKMYKSDNLIEQEDLEYFVETYGPQEIECFLPVYDKSFDVVPEQSRFEMSKKSQSRFDKVFFFGLNYLDQFKNGDVDVTIISESSSIVVSQATANFTKVRFVDEAKADDGPQDSEDFEVFNITKKTKKKEKKKSGKRSKKTPKHQEKFTINRLGKLLINFEY